MQAVLADRFRLVMHHESRTVPGYKLVVGKNGPPKLQEPENEGQPGLTVDQGIFKFRNQSMFLFCATLTGRMGSPVLDQTGLKALYDFNLKIDVDFPEGPSNSADPDQGKKAGQTNWSLSSISKELQKLGLRLESGNLQVDYLVIDHVERPSEN